VIPGFSLAQVDDSRPRMLQETMIFPANLDRFHAGIRRKYARKMEAVFQSERYRTGNPSFPKTFRHRNLTGTRSYPAGKSSERSRIPQKIHGNYAYPFGNQWKVNHTLKAISKSDPSKPLPSIEINDIPTVICLKHF
jgi:hypothetical protein